MTPVSASVLAIPAVRKLAKENKVTNYLKLINRKFTFLLKKVTEIPILSDKK